MVLSTRYEPLVPTGGGLDLVGVIFSAAPRARAGTSRTDRTPVRMGHMAALQGTAGHWRLPRAAGKVTCPGLAQVLQTRSGHPPPSWMRPGGRTCRPPGGFALAAWKAPPMVPAHAGGDVVAARGPAAGLRPGGGGMGPAATTS